MTADDERPVPRSTLPNRIDPKPSGDTGRQGDAQGELFPMERFLEIEEQRIESYNKRTDLGHRAIEAQDAADRRQYDYHVKQLDVQSDQSARQHRFAQQIFWYGGGFCAAILALVLVMLFFGSPNQAASAESILRVIGTAIGGGGALWLSFRAIRWLLTR